MEKLVVIKEHALQRLVLCIGNSKLILEVKKKERGIQRDGRRRTAVVPDHSLGGVSSGRY